MRNPHTSARWSIHGMLALLLASAGPVSAPEHVADVLPPTVHPVGVLDRLEFGSTAPPPVRRVQRPRPATADGASPPVLRNVPLGQRLRIEADCAGCHRIEDRQRPVRALDHAVMT